MPSNCLYTQTGCSPLSWACESGLSEVAQLLINKGANLDIMDKVSFHNEKKLFNTARCTITTHVNIKVIHVPFNCVYKDWKHSFYTVLVNMISVM